MNVSKKKIVIGIIAIVVVSILGYVALLYDASNKIGIEDYKITGAKLIPPTTLRLDLTIYIHSNASIDVEIESITYEIYVNGTKFGEGSKEKFVIKSGTTTPLEISIDVDLLSLGLIIGSLTGNVLEVTVSGTIKVPIKALGFLTVTNVEIPYEETEYYEL